MPKCVSRKPQIKSICGNKKKKKTSIFFLLHRSSNIRTKLRGFRQFYI